MSHRGEDLADGCFDLELLGPAVHVPADHVSHRLDTKQSKANQLNKKCRKVNQTFSEMPSKVGTVWTNGTTCCNIQLKVGLDMKEEGGPHLGDVLQHGHAGQLLLDGAVVVDLASKLCSVGSMIHLMGLK